MHRYFFFSFFPQDSLRKHYSHPSWQPFGRGVGGLRAAARLLLTHVAFQTIYLSLCSAATRGKAERREMDTIMAGIKADGFCLFCFLLFIWNVYLDKKGLLTDLHWGVLKIRVPLQNADYKFPYFLTVLVEFLWLP